MWYYFICHTISDLAPEIIVYLISKDRYLLHFLFIYVLSLAYISIEISVIKLKSFRKHLAY